MNQLHDYVRDRAPGVAWTILHDIGFTSSQRNAVINLITALLDGFLGDYVAIALFGPIWLYYALKAVNVSIPQWIVDVINFVTGNVKPNWNWVVTVVANVQNVLRDLNNRITYIANELIYAVFGPFWEGIHFAVWLAGTVRHILVDFLTNPGGYIRDVVWPFIVHVLPGVEGLVQYWNAVIQPAADFIRMFVHDPARFVLDLLRPAMDAVIAPFKPLLDFIAWWRNVGAPFLVALVSDPQRVILDLITDGFLDWFLRLLARNW